MPDTARLRELLDRRERIKADLDDFDGDRRGHYGALEAATDELVTELLRQAPALLDALDAAEARADKAEAERDALRAAIRTKGGTAHYPIEDAYLLACGALTLHKDRAERAEAEVARLTAERDHQRSNKDQAYEERNRLVALLAGMFPSGIKRTDIPGWNPEWHGAVYIDFPWGQASWHYHDSQAHLFAHLPPYHGEWDGHTTEGKYAAIARAALEAKP